VSYFVMLEDEAALDRAWEGVGEGGTVLMPLDAYDWSSRYGWLEDQFGFSWQLALGSRTEIGGQALAPALLFTGERAGQAEAAIAHYAAVFPDAAVEGVLRHDGSGGEREGTVKHAQFRLCGQTFMATDSALDHRFGFTEANSFLVLCKDQAEIDRHWDALSAVPEAERCGWLKDRFGVSWQIALRHLPALMSDPAAAERVTAAFMEMRKLDIAALERARAG
jgi:predicted 3-demethylubiquinone-9 3-methyltransferase (glyoxalase superfamily)